MHRMCGSPHFTLSARACCAAKRRYLGLPRDFSIFDDDDQTAAVKRALLQLDLPTEDFPPRTLRAQISHAKNHGITSDKMRADAEQARDEMRQQAAEVFATYNSILRKAAALDFDDLLLRSVELLRENEEVRTAWSSRLQYLMVDEFQDTNASQEELVRLLAGSRKNVCVVGDEDQSIYGWRGARAGNLKRFTEDFPGAKIIRLEENYRSTQIILDAAAAVVGNNSDRLGKNLQGQIGPGDRSALLRGAGFRHGSGIYLRRDFQLRPQHARFSSGGALPHRLAVAVV